jgi:3-dehydroquinate dehydratase I
VQTAQSKPRLVGVIASVGDLQAAQKGGVAAVDLCELRIDLLNSVAEEVCHESKNLARPAIITVRDPAEGGSGDLSLEMRLNLLQKLLPVADYIDVEFRNLKPFSGLCEQVFSLGKTLIVSRHFFHSAPSVAELENCLSSLKFPGPWIFKVACRINNWSELRQLTNFLLSHNGEPIALMGMGRLGQLSRLLFATVGSELNYVAFDSAVVPGQWGAREFRDLLDRVTREAAE